MISEFNSNSTNRSASIVGGNNSLVVNCYEKDAFIRAIDVSDHSIYYAEDTAENWISGIIEE